MPQDLRVVPWEQFNSYHEEILEKIDRVPPTVQADEGKILAVSDSDGALEGVYPQSGGGGADLPIYDSSYKNKVLTVKENESNGDIELAGDLINIKDGYWGEMALPDTEQEDGDYVLTLMTGGSQKIEGAPSPSSLPNTNEGEPGYVLAINDNGNAAGTTIESYPDPADATPGDILGLNENYDVQGMQIIPSYDGSDAGKVLTPNENGDLEWSGQLRPLFNIDDWDYGKFLSTSGTGDTLIGVAMPQIPIPDVSNDEGKILTVDSQGQFVLIDGPTYSSMYANNN